MPTKPTTPEKKNKTQSSFMASLLMSSPPSSSSSSLSSSSPPSFNEETHHLNSLKSSISSSPHFSSFSTIWGISLLTPSPSLDVVLLKFLRARDFHVPDALSMLDRCLHWRKDFGADSILDEDLSSDFKDREGVVAYMSGCCIPKSREVWKSGKRSSRELWWEMRLQFGLGRKKK